MTESFRVWAPDRRRVELVAGGRRSDMVRGERGWWMAPEPAPEHGLRYGYSLDGGEVRPDPRSPWQPDGVLGLSAVVDQGRHSWGDAGWKGRDLAGAVIYELHVGTFSTSGTFDGVVEHLPHLVGLGVDFVELMPVAEFPGRRGWGYDGVDLFAPHHAYGGPDGLKRLVDACHGAGLGVLVDVVYNHLGPMGNFLAEFGPYFTDRHQTEWGAALNYDGPHSDEVRRFIVDSALSWMRDYHCDGLRLDAVHAIVDRTPVHVLEQLATETAALGEQLGRTKLLIAESDTNDPRQVRDPERGGYGLTAVWSDDWHHAVHAVVTGERTGYYRDFGSLEQLGKALRQAWVYDGAWSEHRQRTKGRRAPDVPAHRFVVALQNHDQVGNRAVGDRLAAQVGEDRLRAAAALLLASPFTPMLFQGEEWGASTPFLYFTDFEDPQLAQAVKEGRRREFAAFGWDPDQVPDPQDPGTFARSQLRWDEVRESPHRELLDWYRSLIALRHRLPPATKPVGQDVQVDVAASCVTFRRPGVMVRVNMREPRWSVDVIEERSDG